MRWIVNFLSDDLMITAAKETPAYIYVCTPLFDLRRDAHPCLIPGGRPLTAKLHARHSPGGRCTDLAHGYHKTFNGSKYNQCGFREIPGGFGGNYPKFWWGAGGDSGREMGINVEKEQVKGFGASLSDSKRKGVENIMFSSLFPGMLETLPPQGFSRHSSKVNARSRFSRDIPRRGRPLLPHQPMHHHAKVMGLDYASLADTSPVEVVPF